NRRAGSQVDDPRRSGRGGRAAGRPPEPGHQGATCMGTAQTPPPGQALTAGPAAPVPVAFTGRTSTLYLQDPAASLRRQARECADKLPEGMFIAAWYWDIESGGLDIEQRGRSDTWQQADAGISRDGGLADLLAEAASPSPKFAAVICEDIERSA